MNIQDVIDKLNKALVTVENSTDYDSKLKAVKQVLNHFSTEHGKINTTLRNAIIAKLNIELIQKYRTCDVSNQKEELSSIIILINEGLISSVWKNVNLTEDFKQRCREAIAEAIRKYDPNTGYAFSTYASRLIKTSGSKHFGEYSDIKLPKSVYDRIKSIKKAQEVFMNKNGREATVEELANILNATPKKINEALIADKPHIRFSELQPDDSSEGDEDFAGEYVYQHTQNSDDSINRLEQEESAKESAKKAQAKAHRDLYGNDDAEEEENRLPLFEIRTKTRNAENHYHQNDDLRKLLQCDPHKWIEKIPPINPNYYYNRLIGDLFPEFAEITNGNYDPDQLSEKAVNTRNEFVRQAIYDNMLSPESEHINSIELYPGCIYNNVDNALTRNDRIFDVRDIRGKVFLAALAFNLTYDQFENLLVHSLGEKSIDFKNPFEVMLAYCIVCEENSCEHFLLLKPRYLENLDNEYQPSRNGSSTASFESAFWNLRNDNELLDLLYHLPEENSQTARKIFCDEINNICDRLKIVDGINTTIEKYVNGDMGEFERVLVALYNNPDVYKSVLNSKPNATLYNLQDVYQQLVGNLNVHLNDTFAFLRRRIFTRNKLSEMYNGTKPVTKDALILLLFFDYCLSKDYQNIKKKVVAGKYNKTRIFSSFQSFANKKLEKAGFDYIHLANSFELFLAYCLITEDALNAFHMLVHAGED